MIAGPRDERLRVLSELVRWAHAEAKARELGEHELAVKASMRMREAVSILGFDPIEYDAGRDWSAQVVSKRIRKMLDAMPGTSTELAKAAGINPRDVWKYLTPLANRGEINATKVGHATHWEVVP